MKRCPQCGRDYNDDSLSFCLDDGSELLFGPSLSEEPATALLPSHKSDPKSSLPRTGSSVQNAPATIKTNTNGVSAKILALAVGAAIIATAAFFILKYRGSHSGPVNSVAVLPFKNDSGNEELDYLSDGMSELLISSLSEISDLQVKSRSSVYRFKGRDITP